MKSFPMDFDHGKTYYSEHGEERRERNGRGGG